MNIGDIPRMHARYMGNEPAVSMGETRLTWRALNDRTNATASALRQLGVGRGDRVACLAKNSTAYTALYFALAKIGAMLVPLNYWHRPDEHGYVLRDCEPSLVVSEAEHVGLLHDSGAVATGKLMVVGAAGASSVATDVAWPELLEHATSEDEASADLAPDTPHMIMYTSGTTGAPKGAVLSSERTVPGNLGMALGLRVRPDDVFLNYFPTFHASCWDHMMVFMLVGAHTVLLRQFEPAEALAHVDSERVTVMLGLAAMLHRILEDPALTTSDLGSLRLLYYGAYDPSGVLDRMADHLGAAEGRVEMAHTYGLTESAPFVTLCQSQDNLEHWGSVGRPLPGIEVELRDDEGTVVDVGTPGEILVRGPSMVGYWNRPDDTDAVLVDGWLHTGDIAVADGDGFLRIVDRKKDVIRSGGHNISSKAIEDCLVTHELVDEVAIIGVPDPEYEEAVCAVVVLAAFASDDDKRLDDVRADLRTHVGERLAGYNVPRRIEFVEELPRTAVGKTRKNVLRERFGDVFADERGAG